MDKSRIAIATLALTGLSMSAFADDATEPVKKADAKKQAHSTAQEQAPAKLTQPLGGAGLQLKYGYFDTYASKTSSGYLNVSFKDQTLFNRGGTPPSQFSVADDPTLYGDRPVSINVTNGDTQFGGTQFSNFDAIGLQDILQGAFQSELGWIPSAIRLTLAFDQQSVTDVQTNLLYGIEFAPDLSKLSSALYAGNTTETFIAAGVAQEQHTTTTSSNRNAVEYRGRVGLGMNFATTSRRAVELNNDKKNLSRLITAAIHDGNEDSLREASTQVERFSAKYGYSLAAVRQGLVSEDQSSDKGESAKSKVKRLSMAAVRSQSPARQLFAIKNLLESKIDTLPPDKRSPATAKGQLTMNAIPSAEALQEGQALTATLTSQVNQVFGNGAADTGKPGSGSATTPSNQPAFEFFADFDGAYGLNGGFGNTNNRFIYSGNIKWTITPSDPNSMYFQLRYENGYSRAAPTARSNSLIATVGIGF